MFKKFISLMMVFSIFTVTAHASTQNGLKAAFDELNYSLNVEWDQKNQEVYKTKVAEFTATARELMKNMSTAELVAVVKSEIKDARVAKDMETALNIIALNKMSSAEASKYMIDAMEKSFSKGASWNGAANVLLGVGILLVLVAAAAGGGVYYTSPSTYCGYSSWYCGETCYGHPYYYCDPNYCCY